MPSFGKKSQELLDTCHGELRLLFSEVVKIVDCQVTCGRRGKVEQDSAFQEGRSKTPWPQSKHNAEAPNLSNAADVTPFPVEWPDEEFLKSLTPEIRAKVIEYGRVMRSWGVFAGVTLCKAHDLKIPIRWGGDWDGDFDLKDQNFNDLPHFERK